MDRQSGETQNDYIMFIYVVEGIALRISWTVIGYIVPREKYS